MAKQAMKINNHVDDDEQEKKQKWLAAIARKLVEIMRDGFRAMFSAAPVPAPATITNGTNKYKSSDTASQSKLIERMNKRIDTLQNSIDMNNETANAVDEKEVVEEHRSGSMSTDRIQAFDNSSASMRDKFSHVNNVLKSWHDDRYSTDKNDRIASQMRVTIKENQDILDSKDEITAAKYEDLKTSMYEYQDLSSDNSEYKELKTDLQKYLDGDLTATELGNDLAEQNPALAQQLESAQSQSQSVAM